MKRCKYLAVLLCLAMVISLLAACGAPKETEEPVADAPAADVAGTPEDAPPADDAPVTVSTKQTPDGTFILASEAEPANWDPSNGSGPCARTVFDVLYDRLISYNETTGEYEPMLATSWEYLDDLTLKFELRDDVTFHNGTPMTAEDVKFSFERIANVGKYAGTVASIDFEKTEIDGNTITFYLKAPDAALIANISSAVFSIVPKAYVEEVGADVFGQQPIGTGVMKLDSWTSGDRMTLVANEDYWGEALAFDTFVVRFIDDAATRLIELETGAVDAAMSLDSTAINSLANGEIEGAVLATADGWNVRYFGLSTDPKWEVLQDENVRAAIFHAIDVEAICKTIVGSSGTYTTSILPNNIVVGYAEHEAYGYDPELSKQLLAETDYTAEQLTFNCYVTQASTDLKIAEAIQAYLSEVGITFVVSPMEEFATVGAAIKGEVETGFFNSPATANEPDQVIKTMKAGSGHGIAEIKLESVAAYFDEAITEMDLDARQALYEQAQDAIYENYVSLPINQYVYGYAYLDYVQGIQASATGTFYLRGVSLVG